MVGIDTRNLLNLIGEQLQPLDVDKLKYILAESFTSKFHYYFNILTFQLKVSLKVFLSK